MRPLVILCVLAMSVSASQRAAAGVLAGPFPYGGHQYYLLEPTSWTNSEAEAVILGGHLATINDAAENEWVSQIFEGHLWIGFNDVNVEGNFEWVSGEPVTYTNWHPRGEPNNSGGEEHFAKTRSDGLWNDLWDDATNHFGVVEVVPEPADLNVDGFVDGLDLGILLGNFNSIAPPSGGELNGIDPVEGLDLGILLGAWNPPPLAATIPEPTSAMLLLGMVITMFTGGRTFVSKPIR